MNKNNLSFIIQSMYFHHKLDCQTSKQLEIIDLTDRIQGIVSKSKIQNGIVNIQSLHTTASILINEKENLLHEDFRNHLEKIAPKNNDYLHDDFSTRTENMCDGECANGHAHCKALHLPTSVSLNIAQGQLILGMWQRILFLELDRPRPRSIHVMVLGE